MIMGFKLLVMGYLVETEGLGIGALASSLLTHGLQPQSKLSIGNGEYLRDDFRRHQLIPTFRRIKENIQFLQGNNWWHGFFTLMLFGMFLFTMAILGLYIHSMKHWILLVEAKVNSG